MPPFPVRPMRPVRMVAAPERNQTSASTESSSMSVLLPEKLSNEGIEILSPHFSVDKKLDLTPEQLLQEIPKYQAIIIRSGTKMTREVIEAATNLKVIGRAGVGVDNIDIPAATECGILVVNAPTGNCIAAAEHSIALLTSMSRLISTADATVKSGGWNRSAYVGASLVDKTLGVVGLGRIGREVAKRARGLGMNIIASDPVTSEEAASAIGVKLVSFDKVLSDSDFITLHIPLIPSTKGLLNADAFSKMKDGVRIINAARGGIVNEEALLEALESGKVAGAALDCFEFEPPNKHPDSISAKVVKHPKVLATPHLGASTREAQEDVAIEIATAVRDALNGDMVSTMINAPSMPEELLRKLKPRAVLCDALAKLAYHMSHASLKGGVKVDYYISDASEDTRLLRAGIIKGLLEPAMGVSVSIVNADSVLKKSGLDLTEVSHPTASTFDSEVVVSVKDAPVVEGSVNYGRPHVTRIGPYHVDLLLDGIIMMYSQKDQPGQMGRVGSILGENGINISFMCLGRAETGAKALVLMGLDSFPDDEVLKKIDAAINDDELRPMVLEF